MSYNTLPIDLDKEKLRYLLERLSKRILQREEAIAFLANSEAFPYPDQLAVCCNSFFFSHQLSENLFNISPAFIGVMFMNVFCIFIYISGYSFLSGYLRPCKTEIGVSILTPDSIDFDLISQFFYSVGYILWIKGIFNCS